MLPDDIEARLWRDPGQCTLGQLLQDRAAAALEIRRLRQLLNSKRPTEQGAPLTPSPLPTVLADRPAPPQRALLRLSEVVEVLGMARSRIYALIAQGRFPAPLRIGARSVRWSAESLDAWRLGLQSTHASPSPSRRRS